MFFYFQRIVCILGSFFFFLCVDFILRFSKRNTIFFSGTLKPFSYDCEWRNIWLSLIHALFTSILSSGIINMSKNYLDDLIQPKSAVSVGLICFSLGYFLHDLTHIMRGPSRRHSMESALHHFMIIPCYGLAIFMNKYIAYAVVSLVVEINSVFLHIRRLLQSFGIKKNTFLYRSNNLMNISSFLTFRLGTLLWMSWWLFDNRDKVPIFLTFLGTMGLGIIIPLNFGLLYYILKSDFLKKDSVPLVMESTKKKIYESINTDDLSLSAICS